MVFSVLSAVEGSRNCWYKTTVYGIMSNVTVVWVQSSRVLSSFLPHTAHYSSRSESSSWTSVTFSSCHLSNAILPLILLLVGKEKKKKRKSNRPSTPAQRSHMSVSIMFWSVKSHDAVSRMSPPFHSRRTIKSTSGRMSRGERDSASKFT